MKLSKLIALLAQRMAEHGDMEVRLWREETGYQPVVRAWCDPERQAVVIEDR